MLYKTLRSTLPVSFTFAGFNWPRYIAVLPSGSLAKRLDMARKPRVTGPYWNSPRPVDRASGTGFYLDSAGMPGLRYWYARETGSALIRHRGWYCDQFGDQTIEGIVMRLPHARGFLAGWTMGEGMISYIEHAVYESKREAALAADSLAQHAAEREREREEYEGEA